jgi:hypothetical protein
MTPKGSYVEDFITSLKQYWEMVESLENAAWWEDLAIRGRPSKGIVGPGLFLIHSQV